MFAGITSTSGRVWREQRKFAITTLREIGISTAAIHENIQAEVHAYLNELTNRKGAPFNMYYLIEASVCNVICSFAFGKRFDYDDDRFKLMLGNLDKILLNIGPSSLLNFFPFVKYIPGDPVKYNALLKDNQVS
jgi:cytochrome P450 family 2 subfamily J